MGVGQHPVFWGGFSQVDVGKEIRISGRAGPRWFYRPVSRAQRAVIGRLPVNVQIALFAGWIKYVPSHVRRVAERVLFKPSANSGTYVIKETREGAAWVALDA